MIDTQSDTWLHIKAYIDRNKALADSRLRGIGVSVEETNFNRGVWDALDKLEKLPGKKLPEPAPGTEY